MWSSINHSKSDQADTGQHLTFEVQAEFKKETAEYKFGDEEKESHIEVEQESGTNALV